MSKRHARSNVARVARRKLLAPEEPGDFCNQGGRFGPHSVHDSSIGGKVEEVLVHAGAVLDGPDRLARYLR